MDSRTQYYLHLTTYFQISNLQQPAKARDSSAFRFVIPHIRYVVDWRSDRRRCELVKRDRTKNLLVLQICDSWTMRTFDLMRAVDIARWR